MSGRSSEASNGRRGSTAKAPGKSDKPPWRGFVDIRLNDLQKEQVKSIASQSDTDVLGILGALVGQGYKVSFRDDLSNHSSLASLTGVLAGDANEGLTLTGRGPDFITALACVYLKAMVIADGGSWESAGSLGPAGGGIE